MTAMHEIAELDVKGLREFGLTTGGIVIVLFGLILPWLFGVDYPLWPWILGSVLGTWALIAPASLDSVYKGWMKFGLLVSKVTTPLVLGIVFYFVFSPVGWVMRLFGYDPMKRELNDDAPSYRKPSQPANKNHVERPF